MRRLRKLLFVTVVLTVLGGLGMVTYLTHHPDAPLLARAESWPVVGEAARSFRQAYLGTPDGEGDGGTPSAEGEIVYVDADGNEITGPLNLTGRPVHPDLARDAGQRTGPETRAEPPRRQPAARPAAEPPSAPIRIVPAPSPRPRAEEPADDRASSIRTLPPTVRPPAAPPRPRVAGAAPTWVAQEWRWFVPEQPLRRDPRADAEPLGRLRTLSRLPVLADRGDWLQVVYRGEPGWVEGSWRPPYSRRKARRGILRHQAEPVRTSDLAMLRAARKHFGIKKPNRSLGPYQLFTDVEDEALLRFLDQAAGLAEEAYFARFGRLPSGDPLRTAVLFAKESDYRAFGDEADLPTATRAGHAGVGVLAFFAEGRTQASLAGTLVHEIAHLLNDRALAYRLPMWLEEGMAEELGALWLESASVDEGVAAPRFDPYSLNVGSLIEVTRSGRLPTVRSLLSLDRARFYDPGIKKVAYPMSAVFVRYLLEGEDGGHAEGFRHFLARIAVGTGADLMKQLGADLETLDRGFRTFVNDEIAALEARFPGVRFH